MDGTTLEATPVVGQPMVGQPILRWSSRTHSLAEVEAELARVWAEAPLTTQGPDGAPERRVAARTSVLNLVVVARQPELGERAAAVIRMLTGRHPSRTLIVSSADPDGPSWIDAHVQAHCVLPRADAAETCAEFINLVAGGATGQHVAAIVAPLLVHDLPVTLWWPGDPPLGSRQVLDVLDMADRLVVDGASWSGNGLDRLRALVAIVGDQALAGGTLAVSDFAMLRQSRWREAIASCFDRPELQPFLGGLTEVTVRYGAHPGSGPGGTNLIKPLYHACMAGLATRVDGGGAASTGRRGARRAEARRRHRCAPGRAAPRRSSPNRGRPRSHDVIHAIRDNADSGAGRSAPRRPPRGRRVRRGGGGHRPDNAQRPGIPGIADSWRHAGRRSSSWRRRSSPSGGTGLRLRRSEPLRNWWGPSDGIRDPGPANPSGRGTGRRPPDCGCADGGGRSTRCRALGDDRRVHARPDLPPPCRLSAQGDRALGSRPPVVGRRSLGAARGHAVQRARLLGSPAARGPDPARPGPRHADRRRAGSRRRTGVRRRAVRDHAQGGRARGFSGRIPAAGCRARRRRIRRAPLLGVPGLPHLG